MATISRYELASGATRYRVRYRTPDRRQTDKRGFTTKRDAEAFAATVEVTKLKGDYVSPSLGKATVGELGPGWLKRQQGVMKPSAFHSIESAWRVHVEPRWSRKQIAEIAYSDVQSWVTELATKRKATLVITAYSVLARILDDAVRDRRLAANPARGVKLPTRSRRKNVYLTAEQLHALAGEAGRYGSLVLLLGTAGLRWGEAAALRVSDIDFLKRRVVLHENAVAVGSKTHVGTLKSGKSRTVVLPAFVVDELAKTCRGKGRDELLWPSRSGGHLGPPSSHDSWLSGAVERCITAADTARDKEIRASKDGAAAVQAFPRVTAHALRHTAASLAISAGANVKVVQRMLGHASAAMTLDVYADLFDDDLTAVADKLDESVGKMWARRTSEAPQQTNAAN
ncbi:site-specific integrase [Mycobacterium sp. SVM_VP21]|nr:site-specific integrase [Mycobacterium sp. SVM_VP21]